MFRDRQTAGRSVAALLERYRKSDAIVLAIPAGGVPVAAAIAEALGLPLQVIPVSKVLFPWTTEGGYGAVAFDGTEWIDHEAVSSYELKPSQVKQAVDEARTKVERRSARFSSGKGLAVGGKTVIVVDDGVAAGSTMRTAIAALRKHGAKRIVVAVPTGHERPVKALRKLADDIVCPDIRGGMRFAVADAYEEWRDLSDDEIEALLKR